MLVSESEILRSGKPADFSSYDITHINVDSFLKHIGLLAARNSRVGMRPMRGKHRKFLTRSLWLNNNNLESLNNIDLFINATLEYPEELGWIDVSFNKIKNIDESILKFKELKIIYFHGNCISDFEEIEKLKLLAKLRTVTFHGNPIANQPNYRHLIITTLPQVINLDFTTIHATERLSPRISEATRCERI